MSSSSLHELETPALLVDLPAMEGNMAAMARVLGGSTATLRPHFKNHRSLTLAARQMEAGANGISVSRIRHAEALARHGVRSILLTSEVVTEGEFRRIAALASSNNFPCDLLVAVDDAEVVEALSRTAKQRGVTISVIVDVDLGLNRTGVAPTEALFLGQKICASPGLKFRGLTAYEGHLQRAAPDEEKRHACEEALRALANLRTQFEGNGIPVEIVSTGGTGTCSYAAANPAVTEIQAGCYLLMETLYQQGAPQFQPAVSVMATVISSKGDRIILDTGLKAISGERGLGHLEGDPELRVVALHAEHAIVAGVSGAMLPAVGTRVRMTVPYSDGTVNLHRRMFGIRGGGVEKVFEIEQ